MMNTYILSELAWTTKLSPQSRLLKPDPFNAFTAFPLSLLPLHRRGLSLPARALNGPCRNSGCHRQERCGPEHEVTGRKPGKAEAQYQWRRAGLMIFPFKHRDPIFNIGWCVPLPLFSQQGKVRLREVQWLQWGHTAAYFFFPHYEYNCNLGKFKTLISFTCGNTGSCTVTC